MQAFLHSQLRKSQKGVFLEKMVQIDGFLGFSTEQNHIRFENITLEQNEEYLSRYAKMSSLRSGRVYVGGYSKSHLFRMLF